MDLGDAMKVIKVHTFSQKGLDECQTWLRVFATKLG
jgi:hypothetical protein